MCIKWTSKQKRVRLLVLSVHTFPHCFRLKWYWTSSLWKKKIYHIQNKITILKFLLNNIIINHEMCFKFITVKNVKAQNRIWSNAYDLQKISKLAISPKDMKLLNWKKMDILVNFKKRQYNLSCLKISVIFSIN